MAAAVFGVRVPPGSKVARQYPINGDGPPVCYWAQDGVICFVDERDEDRSKGCGKISWPQAKEHLLGLVEMYNTRKIDGTDYAREQLLGERFIHDMTDVIKEAVVQAHKILDANGQQGARIVVPG